MLIDFLLQNSNRYTHAVKWDTRYLFFTNRDHWSLHWSTLLVAPRNPVVVIITRLQVLQKCNGCFNTRVILIFRALHPPICAGISLPQTFNHAFASFGHSQITAYIRFPSLSIIISPSPYPRKQHLFALAVLSGFLSVWAPYKSATSFVSCAWRCRKRRRFARRNCTCWACFEQLMRKHTPWDISNISRLWSRPFPPLN